MNSNLKQKLILTLAKAKQNKGFTLIELLVVIIIIGVLSAVALPNLLGQVGGARETEASNAVGSVNRAQQAFFTERGEFYTPAEEDQDITNRLGVTFDLQFYVDPDTFTQDAAILLTASQPNNNNIRGFGGGVAYDSNADARTFTSVVCRTLNVGDQVEAGNITSGAGDDTTASCATNGGNEVEEVGQ